MGTQELHIQFKVICVDEIPDATNAEGAAGVPGPPPPTELDPAKAKGTPRGGSFSG